MQLPYAGIRFVTRSWQSRPRVKSFLDDTHENAARQSRGFAFVTMGSSGAASKAIADRNRTTVNGQALEVTTKMLPNWGMPVRKPVVQERHPRGSRHQMT